MIKQMEPLKRNMGKVADNAQSLLETTAEFAEEKAGQAQHRIKSALDQAKETYAELKGKDFEDGLSALDDSMHRHFYQSLAIAAGISLLIGFLLARRR